MKDILAIPPQKTRINFLYFYSLFISQLMAIPESILVKIRRYCDYQERCHQEVRGKLIGWKVYGQDLEDTLALLIQENLLNEERYAAAYVRGKFRINGWGKEKIILGLKSKQISEYCIRKGLEEIDEQVYQERAIAEARKYVKSKRTNKDDPELRKKIYYHLRRKGYEHEIAFQSVRLSRQK